MEAGTVNDSKLNKTRAASCVQLTRVKSRTSMVCKQVAWEWRGRVSNAGCEDSGMAPWRACDLIKVLKGWEREGRGSVSCRAPKLRLGARCCSPSVGGSTEPCAGTEWNSWKGGAAVHQQAYHWAKEVRRALSSSTETVTIFQQGREVRPKKSVWGGSSVWNELKEGGWAIREDLNMPGCYSGS